MKSKAVFFTGIKSVEIREIDIPEPEYNEVQVKNLVNGICMFDVWVYNRWEWTDKPFIPGHEGIGVVTKTGKGVKSVKEGDLVTTRNWIEHYNVNEDEVMKLTGSPQNLEKFMIEPALCVVTAAHYSNIYPGERVILFGAGYIGLLFNQLLAVYPLAEIVVVDIKEENLKLAKEFGVTEIVNSMTREGKERINELMETPFDMTYECSGAKEPLDLCTKLTRKGGRIGIYAWHHDPRIVDTNIWHRYGLQILNLSPGIRFGERSFKCFKAAENLMYAGKIYQDKLVTHKYHFTDIKKAMDESVERPDGFLKSILVF